MMGTPLAIYIETEVPNREQYVEAVTVCLLLCTCRRLSSSQPFIYFPETWRSGIAGLQWSLLDLRCVIEPFPIVWFLNSSCPKVDPHSESGQSLYRQYAGKKGKLVLGYRWIDECIEKNKLQAFAENWAGCKITGKEQCVQVLVLKALLV